MADELYARAIVIEEAGRRAALVSADLLWLDREQCAVIRRHIEDIAGVPAANVLITCTHTHSGPDTLDWYDFAPPIDRAWLATLLRQIASAAFIASRDLTDVDLYWAQGQVQIGANRRLAVEGSIERAPNLFGPVDHTLTTVWFVTPTGKIVAAILHQGTHPVVLGPESQLVSGDWCGLACQYLERRFHAPCLYLNGLSGDVNPLVGSGRSYQTALKVARRVALAAISSMRDSSHKAKARVAISVNAHTLEVSSYQHPYLRQSQDRRMHRDGGMVVEVQGVCMGPIALLGMPGEVLVETGESVRKSMSARLVLVISGANDYVGYLPLPHIIAEGGYEARARMLGEDGILRCLQAARQLLAQPPVSLIDNDL